MQLFLVRLRQFKATIGNLRKFSKAGGAGLIEMGLVAYNCYVMNGKMCVVRVRASPSHPPPNLIRTSCSTGRLALRGQQSLPRPSKIKRGKAE